MIIILDNQISFDYFWIFWKFRLILCFWTSFIQWLTQNLGRCLLMSGALSYGCVNFSEQSGAGISSCFVGHPLPLLGTTCLVMHRSSTLTLWLISSIISELTYHLHVQCSPNWPKWLGPVESKGRSIYTRKISNCSYLETRFPPTKNI
jgi:hypothetical protein